ncbi:hypothetical protein RM61_15045 [Xanthomonas phaseoli pv. phaseoli]|uniref:hypothetical protein n=1 Tax=Xanthomonas phaseoli TaxID=1985254 RepID=UPI000574F270|nr:hypothetical protein [Xanthomonas phaseoli]KHS06583.1 hypothetical protein RM61_15045 [Xanthomonas phaseoli pv. phaseoli]
MAAKPKSGPMCVITIGYQHLLMPVAEGMKVVALLANAIDVEFDHTTVRRVGYVAGDEVQVRFETVTAGQIRLPSDIQGNAARGALRLQGPSR